MISIVKGNLLDAKVDAICHQVNCRGVMGAGVAKAISDKWPIVKLEYEALCTLSSSPYDLLGTAQVVNVKNGLIVINLFGQLNYGRNKVCYTDYNALEKAMKSVNEMFKGMTIALPWKIGCGLAGGDWATVEEIIMRSLKDCEVKIYALL